MATLLTAASAQSVYDRFFDEYYFPFNPTTATSAGIHKYDDKLEDYSKAGIAKHVARRSRSSKANSQSCPSRPTATWC